MRRSPFTRGVATAARLVLGALASVAMAALLVCTFGHGADAQEVRPSPQSPPGVNNAPPLPAANAATPDTPVKATPEPAAAPAPLEPEDDEPGDRAPERPAPPPNPNPSNLASVPTGASSVTITNTGGGVVNVGSTVTSPAAAPTVGSYPLLPIPIPPEVEQRIVKRVGGSLLYLVTGRCPNPTHPTSTVGAYAVPLGVPAAAPAPATVQRASFALVPVASPGVGTGPTPGVAYFAQPAAEPPAPTPTPTAAPSVGYFLAPPRVDSSPLTVPGKNPTPLSPVGPSVGAFVFPSPQGPAPGDQGPGKRGLFKRFHRGK